MIFAAGVIFLTPDHEVLLLQRSAEGDAASLWAFPGGAIEPEEDAESAARRETEEETGFAYSGPLMPWTRRIHNEVDYTTFLARIPERFTPKLNNEHTAWEWHSPQEALAD